jgi:hypothetical protein
LEHFLLQLALLILLLLVVLEEELVVVDRVVVEAHHHLPLLPQLEAAAADQRITPQFLLHAM